MSETPTRPPAIRDGPAGASAYDDTKHNGLSRKFWSGKNIGPGEQYSRKCSENIGPSLKIWVRLATVSGKSAKIVFSGAVVSFKRFNS